MSSATGNLSIRRRVSWTPFWFVYAYSIMAVLWRGYFQCSWSASGWPERACFLGPWGAAVALTVWVAWGTTPFRRIPLALIALAWFIILSQCVRWSLPHDTWPYWFRDALSLAGVALPLLGISILVLICARCLTGLRLADPPGNVAVPFSRWQFQILHILILTTIAAAMMAAVTQIFSTVLDGDSLGQLVRESAHWIRHPLRLLFICLLILPIAIIAAFAWRWLLPALTLTFVGSLIIALGINQSPSSALVSFSPLLLAIFRAANILIESAPITGHAAVLLLVLRWQGYRLTRVRPQHATTVASAAGR